MISSVVNIKNKFSGGAEKKDSPFFFHKYNLKLQLTTILLSFWKKIHFDQKQSFTESLDKIQNPLMQDFVLSNSVCQISSFSKPIFAWKNGYSKLCLHRLCGRAGRHGTSQRRQRVHRISVLLTLVVERYLSDSWYRTEITMD